MYSSRFLRTSAVQVLMPVWNQEQHSCTVYIVSIEFLRVRSSDWVHVKFKKDSKIKINHTQTVLNGVLLHYYCVLLGSVDSNWLGSIAHSGSPIGLGGPPSAAVGGSSQFPLHTTSRSVLVVDNMSTCIETFASAAPGLPANRSTCIAQLIRILRNSRY